MEELIRTVYEKYEWLQWILLLFGAGLAYVTIVEAKNIFTCIDEEMWKNH